MTLAASKDEPRAVSPPEKVLRLMDTPVVIEAYDPRWPRMFEKERSRILAALGSHRIAVEHVGSTAVPGLAAKPIIDILAGVTDFDDAARCIPSLETLGYEYLPERELETPDRKFLARPRTRPRTHHVHMAAVGSDFWIRHLAFRDYLRTHADAASEYEALKRALAAKFREDREAYTEGKTEFVRRIEGIGLRSSR